MHIKNIRNMKFNGYIFKIHTKKRYMRNLRVSLQTSLEKNFVRLFFIGTPKVQ